MGQLLMILIVPPLVGIVTYAVFRFIWKRSAGRSQSTTGREVTVAGS